ncbi:MAG: methyltransferase family protein [Promethearchaeota archaeon]
MKEKIRKVVFGIVDLVLKNLGFLIFALVVYRNLIFLLAIIILNVYAFLDALIRPITEKKEEGRYQLILSLLFFLQPFYLILPFIENEFFISVYFDIWNIFVISYIGIVILIISVLIGLVSRIQIGRYGSGLLVIEENHKLISSGIYKYIRHPIYLGGILGMFGFALAFRSCITAFVFLILFFWVYKKRMDQEERLLEAEFGEKYREYMNRTNRLIPFIY